MSVLYHTLNPCMKFNLFDEKSMVLVELSMVNTYASLMIQQKHLINTFFPIFK